MNRRDIILAGMSGAETSFYTPVQIQKMFFLIDENIPELINGKKFDFQPYHYGPFDKEVYLEIDELAKDGFTEIVFDGRKNLYKLTQKGVKKGKKVLSSLDQTASDYIKDVSNYVRSLSFTELVSSIYKAYPHMKINSVFQY